MDLVLNFETIEAEGIPICHSEERSDGAIQRSAAELVDGRATAPTGWIASLRSQ
jgi:hypothetical protein